MGEGGEVTPDDTARLDDAIDRLHELTIELVEARIEVAELRVQVLLLAKHVSSKLDETPVRGLVGA